MEDENRKKGRLSTSKKNSSKRKIPPKKDDDPPLVDAPPRKKKSPPEVKVSTNLHLESPISADRNNKKGPASDLDAPLSTRMDQLAEKEGCSKPEEEIQEAPQRNDQLAEKEEIREAPQRNDQLAEKEVPQKEEKHKISEGGGRTSEDVQADRSFPLLDGRLKPLRRDSWLDDVSSSLPVPSAQGKKKKQGRAMQKVTDPSVEASWCQEVDSQVGSKVHVEGPSSSCNSQDSSSSGNTQASSSSSGSSLNKWAVPLYRSEKSDELPAKLLHFLHNFIKDSDGDSAYYVSEARAMKARNSNLLTIDFNHFLSQRYYVHIALKVGNEDTHDWMVPTVSQFLKKYGCEAQNVVIFFLNKPESICPLKSFMSSKACWSYFPCCSTEVCALTEHGRLGFVAGVRSVVDNHVAEICYGGNFDIDDILMVNSNECLVFADEVPCNPTNCKLDMSKTWAVYEPYFRLSSSNQMASYPLEFEDFVEELTRVEESRVMTGSYRQTVYFYPTIAPIMARDIFLSKFFHIVCRGEKDDFLLVIPNGRHPSTWRTAVGAGAEDWREEHIYHRNGSIMDLVFHHEHDKKLRQQGGVQGVSQVQDLRDTPFEPTVFGQVWYKRNVVEHAPHHGATDSPELIELYATSNFKHLMGYLFKKIMELSPAERKKKYGYVLAAYMQLFPKPSCPRRRTTGRCSYPPGAHGLHAVIPQTVPKRR